MLYLQSITESSKYINKRLNCIKKIITSPLHLKKWSVVEGQEGEVVKLSREASILTQVRLLALSSG